MKSLLICTDLDRTLIPNGKQPESPGVREAFHQLVTQAGVTLTYVTGRDQRLVKQAIQDYQLPNPQFVIADVGSTIYTLQQNQWQRLSAWDDKIGVDWQNQSAQDLIPLFADIRHCRLQEAEKQGLHKLSYYVSLDLNAESIMVEMRQRLEVQKLNSNLIWSIDEAENIGLLDILPRSANKRYAIAFLMEQEGFTLENTVFSGDSGNDFDVLVSPIKAILVANASEALKAKVQSQARVKGLLDALYLATGAPGKFNGNYSGGILEGISHYFPDF